MSMERLCSNEGCRARIVVDGRNVRIDIEMGKTLCDECRKWLTEVVG